MAHIRNIRAITLAQLCIVRLSYHTASNCIVMRVNNITIVGNMCIRLTRHVASIVMNIRTARRMIDSVRRIISNSGRTHKRIMSGARKIDMIRW